MAATKKCNLCKQKVRLLPTLPVGEWMYPQHHYRDKDGVKKLCDNSLEKTNPK